MGYTYTEKRELRGKLTENTSSTHFELNAESILKNTFSIVSSGVRLGICATSSSIPGPPNMANICKNYIENLRQAQEEFLPEHPIRQVHQHEQRFRCDVAKA